MKYNNEVDLSRTEFDQFFSNASGDPGTLEPMNVAEAPAPVPDTKSVDWGKIATALSQGAELVAMLPQKQRTQLEAAVKLRCGRKPILPAKKKEWDKCAAQVAKEFAYQTTPAPAGNNQPQIVYRTPPKKKNNTAAIVLGVLGVAAVVGGVIYFKRRGGSVKAA